MTTATAEPQAVVAPTIPAIPPDPAEAAPPETPRTDGRRTNRPPNAKGAPPARVAAVVPPLIPTVPIDPADRSTVAAEQPTKPRQWRFWTGGPGSPQTTLLKSWQSMRDGEPVYHVDARNGRSEPAMQFKRFKPDRSYAYVVDNEEDAHFLRTVLGSQAWEDDLADGAPSMVCQHCRWSCRSTQAFQYHVNNMHPGPRNTRI